MSDIRLNVVLQPNDGSSDSTASIVAKSVSGNARIRIGIEAGDKPANLSIKLDDNGNPVIELDAHTINQIAEKIEANISKWIYQAATLRFLTGDGMIKADRNMSVIGEQVLNLATNKLGNLNLGGGNGKITLERLMQVSVTDFLMKAIANCDITSPHINLTGRVSLGGTGGLPIARQGDQVQVSGVETGRGVAVGTIINGSGNNTST